MTSALQMFDMPWRRALRAWDKVSIYLPILLMAALALGTYWLVRNTPVFTVQEAPKIAKGEVDYFMRKFTIQSFGETGQLKSELYGVEGRHYADSDILEIDQPRVTSISNTGQSVISTSDRALSNSDGSEVQLIGNAHVVREAATGKDGKVVPRLEFKGEFLHAFVNEERVKSHLPVVLIRGADQFTGDTFSYDNLTGVAVLKGRVKGRLMPGSRKVPAR